MSDSIKEERKKGVSRKEFLKTSTLSGMAMGSMLLGCSTAKETTVKDRGKAKNVIFMVSDGMSSGTLSMADLHKHRQFGNRSNWMELYNSDRTFHRGLMDMASLNSPVTDSAAAGSSWGCGKRINNGAINMGPEGEKYQPVNQIFKDAGKKTGLVTTTRLTHATPASFSINIDDRGKEDQIAEKYLQREYDVMLGGGARHFEEESRSDGKDLVKEFSNKNYTVVRSKKELSEASSDDRLLGLFFESHLPYTIDHKTIEEYRQNIPTLAEMTEKAVERLENKDGFILQVEGGRVDHGAHANDATGMLYDQIAFDDAVKVALDYIEGRDDTLLIITTDHGNGNPALNGAGSRYRESSENFNRLQNFKHSNTWILSDLDGSSSVSQIRERIKYGTELEISKEEAGSVQSALNGNLDTLYDIQNTPSAVLGSILANYTSINFTSGNHTSDYIELAALGPGIQRLDHFTRNTELFDLMIDTAGVNRHMVLA